jgi:hypothetical protein
MSETRSPITATPNQGEGVFYQGDTPPNTIIIDDMDLGNDPSREEAQLQSDLEGYWNRANGIIYPKIYTDKVGIGVSSFTDDSILHVAGRIYTSGLRLGDNTVLYENVADNAIFQINSTTALHISEVSIDGPVFYLGASGVTFAFVGDTDTGMQRIATNSIALVVGGSSSLVLAADGKIRVMFTPPTEAVITEFLVWDSVSKEVRKRNVTELHTHDNQDVLDLLLDVEGTLWYDGHLVADFTNYYNKPEIDDIIDTVYSVLSTKGAAAHTHTLASLSERNYSSLTGVPDLTSLHSHANKPVLDRIPDDTTANDGDVLTKDGIGLAWMPGGTGSGDKYYVHTQSTPSTTWSVVHNLNKKPSVCVINGAGNVVLCNITYVDDNNLTINPAGAFSGVAYCN